MSLPKRYRREPEADFPRCTATDTVLGHCSQMTYEEGREARCYYHRKTWSRVTTLEYRSLRDLNRRVS